MLANLSNADFCLELKILLAGRPLKLLVMEIWFVKKYFISDLLCILQNFVILDILLSSTFVSISL